MTENKMTICAECAHLISEGPIWYSNWCGAITHEKVIDPVSGKEGYAGRDEHPHCRDINQGACEEYEEMKS